MRVFVTGATSYVGSKVVEELLAHGHQVLGLVRSDKSAALLSSTGAGGVRGTLTDLDVLKKSAGECGGVIHLAFNHDFTKFAASCAEELKAIETIGEALKGSNKPFITTSGTLAAHVKEPNQVATEDDRITDPTKTPTSPRIWSEIKTIDLVKEGVRAMVVRLSPTTHGDGDKGFVPKLIGTAKTTGVSAYIGDGTNVWPAGHRLDAAPLYRLALEKGKAGSIYHNVGDQAIQIKQIAEIIGRKLNVPVESKTPEEAGKHFGFLAWPLEMNNPTSSLKTQESLGWKPVQVGLIEDLENGGWYFSTEALESMKSGDDYSNNK
ncbi:nucleoside-diphosphate-sugar epimerase [Amylocarpus encephaloides]|uniref:Nucleoside-diphosphate-sugar epimerase n=1 Tax=Amylocarpus encephaloides TaxID=45428 RepID=A0A9P7Y839_9HELO|nr:nucleoside-diphosphate-sugar epimerase [Amylocarpus encephaloides]